METSCISGFVLSMYFWVFVSTVGILLPGSQTLGDADLGIPRLTCVYSSATVKYSDIQVVSESCDRLVFPVLNIKSNNWNVIRDPESKNWKVSDTRMHRHPLLKKTMELLREYNKRLKMILNVQIVGSKNLTSDEHMKKNRITDILSVVREYKFTGLQITYHGDNGSEQFLDTLITFLDQIKWRHLELDVVVGSRIQKPAGFWRKYDEFITHYRIAVDDPVTDEHNFSRHLRNSSYTNLNNIMEHYTSEGIAVRKLMANFDPGMYVYALKTHRDDEEEVSALQDDISGDVVTQGYHCRPDEACQFLRRTPSLNWDTSRDPFISAVHIGNKTRLFYDDLSSLADKVEYVRKLNITSIGVTIGWQSKYKIFKSEKCAEINKIMMKGLKASITGNISALNFLSDLEETILYKVPKIAAFLPTSLLYAGSAEVLNLLRD